MDGYLNSKSYFFYLNIDHQTGAFKRNTKITHLRWIACIINRLASTDGFLITFNRYEYRLNDFYVEELLSDFLENRMLTVNSLYIESNYKWLVTIEVYNGRLRKLTTQRNNCELYFFISLGLVRFRGPVLML